MKKYYWNSQVYRRQEFCIQKFLAKLGAIILLSIGRKQ